MNQQLQQVPPAILARRRNRINGLIGKTERQLEQSLRWLRWLYAPLGIYFWVMVCFVAVCIGLLLWGKDLTFWLPITLIACILLATLAATNPGWERTRYVAEQKIEAMIALHRAILAGDGTRAPLAGQQPTSLPANATEQSHRLPALPIPMQRMDLSWSWIGFLCAIFYALFGLHNPGDIIFFCLLLAFNLLYLALEWYRRHRRIHFTIMPDGLAWRRGHEHRLTRWEAIHAVCIDDPNAATLRQRTYLIATGDTTLAWTTTSASTREELAATNTLLWQVVSHTELPLRDITQSLKQIIAASDVPPWRWRVRSLLGYALSLLVALVIVAGVVLVFIIRR